jgi:hypothetical protein
MWPLAFGQIHTSVQAGGTASALMRFSVGVRDLDALLGFVSEALPARSRRMPGLMSLT